MTERLAFKAAGAPSPAGDIVDRWFADATTLEPELGEFAPSVQKAVTALRRAKVAILNVQARGLKVLRQGGRAATAMGAATTVVGANGPVGNQIIAQTQRALRDKLAGDTAEQANKLATACVDSMTELRAQIDATRSRFRGPRSMGPPLSLEAAIARGRIVEEIKALGCVKARQTAETYLAAKDLASYERWMDAACDVAQVRAKLSPPLLVKELGGEPRAGAVDNERLAALQLLADFDSYREAQMPEAVRIAEKAIATLGEVFAELVGTHERWFSTERWRREGYTRNWPAFEVDPAFLVRRLPPQETGVRPLWMPTEGAP